MKKDLADMVKKVEKLEKSIKNLKAENKEFERYLDVLQQKKCELEDQNDNLKKIKAGLLKKRKDVH